MVVLNWFKGLFKKQARDTTVECDAPVTLMKFDSGKLFKGHSGSIYAYDDRVFFYNKYFSGDVMQEFSKDGKATIRVTKSIRNTKWLNEKLESLSKRLDIYGPLQLQMQKKDILYVIGYYSTYSVKEYTTTGREMLGHHDAINKIKDVGRGLPYLLTNFKSMDIDYLVDMLVGMNPSNGNTDLVFKIDDNMLP